MQRILLMIVLGLSMAACQSESEDADDAENQETCADLTEAECETSKVCTPSWAYEYEDGTFESKPDSLTFIACRDAGPNDGPCGDALNCAYEAETEGACWMFSSTCLPEGWISLNCTQPCPDPVSESPAGLSGGC